MSTRTSQPQCLRLKRFTSAYFLPAIFRHSLPACLLVATERTARYTVSPVGPAATSRCNRRARVPMLLCPLDFCVWLCVCRSFGSPVVWVTRRSSGPSQLLQMVKKKRAQEGERGGSVVITSWLGGSAKAACKTSAATGTRGCECRLLGGPRCLRGRVLVLVRVFV